MADEEPYAWATPRELRRLSDEPFGEELARRVANRLSTGKQFGYFHREHCGDGLAYLDRRYQLHELLDGSPCEARERWRKDEFIAWLARQSDRSCSRADPSAPEFYTEQNWLQNNQTITRERLHAFMGDPPPPRGKPMDGVRRWLDRWLGPAR